MLGGFFEPKRLTKKKMGSRSPVVCCEKTSQINIEKDTYLDLPKGAKLLLKSIQHLLGVNWHTLEGAGIQKKHVSFAAQPDHFPQNP